MVKTRAENSLGKVLQELDRMKGPWKDVNKIFKDTHYLNIVR